MKEFESEDIRRVKDKDVGLLNELLEKWRPLLKLYAQGSVTSVRARVDSSDVVQDTLAKLAENLDQFRGNTEMEFVAWARAILNRTASHTRRYHSAQKRDAARNVAFADSNELATNDSTDRLVEQEDMLRLATAIGKLTPSLQDVVVRRVIHCQDCSQIAHETGTAESTVRVSWQRAIKKLRSHLKTVVVT